MPELSLIIPTYNRSETLIQNVLALRQKYPEAEIIIIDDGSTDKTEEETLDYIRCMTLTKNVDPHVYENLSADNIEAINNYIWAPMTATTFSKEEPIL